MIALAPWFLAVLLGAMFVGGACLGYVYGSRNEARWWCGEHIKDTHPGAE